MGCSLIELEKESHSLLGVLPIWPKQVAISLEYQEILSKILKKTTTLLSEYSFANFFLFAQVYDYRISIISDTVIITGKDSGGTFAVFPCTLPSMQIINTIVKNNYYIKMISSVQKHTLLELIPPTQKIMLVANEGDFDYMYKRENLELLSGRKFHKKRNQVNFFQKSYPVHRTEPITPQNVQEVCRVLNIWKRHHGKTEDDYQAIIRGLLNFRKLPLFGQITYVNNVSAGFVIGEMRNGNIGCVIHFEKADIKYHGIYQYINQTFAKSLPPECKVINREQDLGSEGLRQAKHTYKPNAMLKKYRLFFID